MFLYKSLGVMKYVICYFKVTVEGTFTSRTTIDDLQDGTRLITIDVLVNPKQGAPRSDQVEICAVGLNSNHWQVVEGSHSIMKVGNPEALMFVLLIKPIQHENQDYALLKRKHREVFTNPANWLQLTQDKLECTDSFLLHENLVITKGKYSEELCRNFIELTMILKYTTAQETIFFMRSLTELRAYSYSSSIKDSSGQDKRSVKTKFFVPSEVEHNFDESPFVILPVEIKVDCSMLPVADHPHIFVRAVNPSEKKLDSKKSGTEKPMKENLFNWVGKTKVMIEKVPALEEPAVRKDRDWASVQRMFEAVKNIKHYAVFDAKTGEIWLASPEFCFKQYQEKAGGNNQIMIDEKSLAMKFFQLHGNVKTNIGIRFMEQKFMQRSQSGYDTSRHMAVFMNEGRTMGGVTGRTGACIMVGLYARNSDQPLSQVDPEIGIWCD